MQFFAIRKDVPAVIACKLYSRKLKNLSKANIVVPINTVLITSFKIILDQSFNKHLNETLNFI